MLKFGLPADADEVIAEARLHETPSAEILARPLGQRILIAAAVCHIHGTVATVVAERHELNYSALRRGSRLLHQGINPGLLQLLWDGHLSVAQAMTAADEFPPEMQDEMVRCIQAGTHPSTQIKRTRARLKGGGGEPPNAVAETRPEQDAYSSRRGPAVTRGRTRDADLAVLTRAAETLRQIVVYGLEPITELDDTVNPAESARLSTEFRKHTSAINRVNRLLKERMNA